MFVPQRLPLTLAVAALTGSASTWAAESTGTSTELAPVTVTGQAATKTVTPFITTPQATSQVGYEQWEQRGADSVQRALGYTPGVYTNQIGASNRYDYIVLRGFSDGSLSNTFLDGLKLMGDTNSYSSLVIDPWFLDSIEVVKGPASVLYGRASPGGVVALNRKRPEFTSDHRIRLGIGDHDRRAAAFDFTGAVTDNVAFRLSGMMEKQDTQFGPVEEERRAIAPSLTWDISSDTRLTVMAYLQDDPEGGYHSGMPYEGTVTDHAGHKIDHTFFEGETDYDKFERKQRLFSYDLEHDFNAQWRLRHTLRYLESDVKMGQVYGYGWASETDLNRYYSGGDEEMKAWAIDNQLLGQFDTGPIQHRVLIGLDYQQRRNDVIWTTGSFPSINAFNPRYGADATSIAVSTDQRHKLEQTGVYLQDQLTWQQWSLTLGGRYDSVDITNTDHLLNDESTLDDTQFSGRAGLLYRFNPSWSAYVSYSTAFTPTSFVDANNDLLEPMEGRQIETGLKFQPEHSLSQYSIALFKINQENVATKEQPTDDYRAVGEIESQGVELEANTQLTDQLSLQASYSFTDITYAKSDDGNQGNRAIYAPRHQASAWAHYAFDNGLLAGLDAGVGVRYSADIQADRANTHTLPHYTLLDATLGYDLSALGLDGLSTRLNVTNLLDKEYIASCNSLEYCYFGAERSVKADLIYQF